MEELGSRLAQRGHEVTVYCRSHHIKYGERTYKGMQLVKLPTIPNKYLDTIVHTFVSMVHASLHRHDIAMTFIAGNSLACWIPRLAGIKVVLNVDGLDWKREKWPTFAKKYIQFAEYLATVLPHEVVTDSRRVQDYYRDRFKRDSVYIAYGADVETLPPGPFLKRYGLEPGGYVLFVGRLVPENCAHHLVEAFQRLDTELKCVIVGDAPYAEDYIAELRDVDDPRIVFTGYLYGHFERVMPGNVHRRLPIRWALVVTALFFGLCHGANFLSVPADWVILQMVWAFVVMLIYGLSRQWTGSILYCIGIHMIINYLSCLMH